MKQDRTVISEPLSSSNIDKHVSHVIWCALPDYSRTYFMIHKLFFNAIATISLHFLTSCVGGLLSISSVYSVAEVSFIDLVISSESI